MSDSGPNHIARFILQYGFQLFRPLFQGGFYVERDELQQGRDLSDLSLAEMEVLWEGAKKARRDT